MTSPEVEVTDASAQALIAQAKRLGLTWTLTPGTTDIGGTVTMDGDQESASIDAMSLIGDQLPGQRVMCLQIMTGGNYIIGSIAPVPARGALMAKLRRAAAQAFATSGTADEIEFDTVDYDPYEGFDSGSPTNWVVPFAGWYHAECRINWATNATSRRAAFVDASIGGTICGASLQAAAAGSTQCGGSGTMELVAGEILTLRGIQNSGGSLNTGTTDNGSQMDIIFLGLA